MNRLHVVLPDAARNAAQPSGGNRYDVEICAGLAASGWDVREHPVADSWPAPGSRVADALSATVDLIPSGSVVLVDGLIASATASVLVPQVQRLTLVVLMHMPTWTGQEQRVLRAASAIVATSGWARDQLVARHALSPRLVFVAEPGVSIADPATGRHDALLNIGALTAIKGQDALVAALARVQDIPDWHLRFVGALDREPAFASRVREQARSLGISDRLAFDGVRVGGELDAAYSASGAVVVASRAETFGLAVTEALARGLPVIATNVGGIPQALGTSSSGPPGLLVDADDESELANALRAWLDDGELRRRLRTAARERRTKLTTWSDTVERIATALRTVREEARCG